MAMQSPAYTAHAVLKPFWPKYRVLSASCALTCRGRVRYAKTHAVENDPHIVIRGLVDPSEARSVWLFVVTVVHINSSLPARNEAVLRSCGIDYITVSTKHPASSSYQLKVAEGLLANEEQRGCFAKPWSMAGFEGFVCGECEFGMRNEESLIRLHGALSHEYWRHVLDHADNCSRIDLEVTSASEESVAERIQKCVDGAYAYYSQQRQMKEPKCISGPDGPQSLYMGQRTSAIYLRCYDKFRKHAFNEWKQCVRFEAEIKGKRAIAVARELMRLDSPNARIHQNVAALFKKRGVSLECLSTLTGLNSLPAKIPDRQRLLLWMRTQVRPSIIALMNQGDPEEVIQALGLMGFRGGPWTNVQHSREKEGSDE